MVPQRRVIGLATYGLSSKAPALRRLEPRRHRLAVMVATVKVLTGRATDDVLELFDLLMVTDLMSKAERESRDEKLRRYPRVSRYAGKLAAAVKVLLEMTEVEPDLSLDMMWDLIENTATKSELRAAVAVIDELVPVDDAELNEQRLEELAGRLATVRVFLPPMMRTVVFGATADGAAVLAAMNSLGELMSTHPVWRTTATGSDTGSDFPHSGNFQTYRAGFVAGCQVRCLSINRLIRALPTRHPAFPDSASSRCPIP